MYSSVRNRDVRSVQSRDVQSVHSRVMQSVQNRDIQSVQNNDVQAVESRDVQCGTRMYKNVDPCTHHPPQDHTRHRSMNRKRLFIPSHHTRPMQMLQHETESQAPYSHTV